LEALSQRFNLLLLARGSCLEVLWLLCNGRFQFLDLALLFEKHLVLFGKKRLGAEEWVL